VESPEGGAANYSALFLVSRGSVKILADKSMLVLSLSNINGL
jgi:hypothetical protein